MKCEVKNLDGEVVGTDDLPDSVFCFPPRSDIIARVVQWQLAKRRSGTHKTRGISEISGTTKKPWRQKGTGKARAGSLRAPQFRKGAVSFGPVVRSHGYSLQKKVRALGLIAALSTKLKEDKLIILNSLSVDQVKVKPILAKLVRLGVTDALFVGGNKVDDNFLYSTRNIPNIDVLPIQGINVYDIMRHDTLVITREAISNLGQKLDKKIEKARKGIG